MLDGFLESWSLFGATYAAGILAAAALAQVGVWVVARNQIFLGAAVAQASALGVAVALFAIAWMHFAADELEGDLAPSLLAVLASILTAWVAGHSSWRTTSTTDARTGWIFLAASAGPALLLAHRPHGLEEIERLMFSTLLAASALDAWLFAGLGLLGALATARFGRAWLLSSVDPETAAAAGMNLGRWRLAYAIWLGCAVGLSMRAAGTLFTFGCLVLPALAAGGLTREVRTLVWVAPALAAATTFAGFGIAHAADWPPAHATIALLCLVVVAGRLVPRTG
jgi:zinc transport system permease protein